MALTSVSQSNTESNVTIMATSIPVLRVLVKDVKNSIFSKRRYYGTSGDGGISHQFKIVRKIQNEMNPVILSIRLTSNGTDSSELSVLNKSKGVSPRRGDMLHTI